MIFGGGGDLTRQKLVPALIRLHRSGHLPKGVQVIAVGRRANADDAFRADLRESLDDESAKALDGLAPALFYRRGDVEDAASLGRLRTELDGLSPTGTPEVARLFYLALSPELFARAVRNLVMAGLLYRHELQDRVFRRIVVEKPFGNDLRSARELNDTLHDQLNEHQIFRIDHYLGKETVQNLLGLRFHNAIFEPLWNRHHVELVQITVAESIGMTSGRAAYYDGTGAVRDMLQNHMLQVLSLVAMEPPVSLAAEAIRNNKVEVLRALVEPDAEDVARHCVRARYTAGRVDDRPVVGYLEEEGVPPDSRTETYVAVRAEIDNWRWSGVPFLLRHGKRLARRFTEVQVQFRTPPLQLFNRPPGMSAAELRRQVRDGNLCLIRPNVLTIGIQPHETISLSFGVKQPGPQMVMRPATLGFDYREQFGQTTAPAYERLLLDALQGDATLFLRSDEIEASWGYCDALRAGWTASGAPPLQEYPAGSWGPPEANGLFYGCEGGWSSG